MTTDLIRKEARMIGIVPRSNLYLRETDLIDGHRFARLFGEVWRTLPLFARRRMLRYFRDGWALEAMITGGPSPAILITAEPIEGGGLGCWRQKRGAFFFWAEAVNRLPDTHLRTLIAHELVHCVLTASGEDSSDEMWVRETNIEWGYDENALDDWIEEHAPEWNALQENTTL